MGEKTRHRDYVKERAREGGHEQRSQSMFDPAGLIAKRVHRPRTFKRSFENIRYGNILSSHLHICNKRPLGLGRRLLLIGVLLLTVLLLYVTGHCLSGLSRVCAQHAQLLGALCQLRLSCT